MAFIADSSSAQANNSTQGIICSSNGCCLYRYRVGPNFVRLTSLASTYIGMLWTCIYSVSEAGTYNRAVRA